MFTREELPTRREHGADDVKISMGSSTSKTCLGLKDPRIVRASRSFGGKDRHSKVFTMRGLRDRRVRLSVQTAIQLYDLQDRLRLNQPSKAVDWLLDVAQHKIDLLPPLQMPQENFVQHQQLPVSHEKFLFQAPPTSLLGANADNLRSIGSHSLANSENVKSSDTGIGEDQTVVSRSTYRNIDVPFRAKCKEVMRGRIMGKGDQDEQENQEAIAPHGQQVFPYTSLPRSTHPSFPCFINSPMIYPSYHQREFSSNSSSPHSKGYGYQSQLEETYNQSTTPIPSSLALSSGSQLQLYPSETMQSNFPPYVATSIDCDPKNINNFQMLSSTSQNLQINPMAASFYSINPTMRPFQLNIAPKHHFPQKNDGSQKCHSQVP